MDDFNINPAEGQPLQPSGPEMPSPALQSSAFAPQPQAFVPQTTPRTSGPLPPFTAQEIRSFRHKAEMPIYTAMVVFNVFVIAFAVVASILAFFDIGPLTGTTGAMFNQLILGIPAEASAHVEVLFILIALPFVLLFAVYLYYAQYRANAIRITEKNFPEIYEVVEDYARRLGLKKVPKIYLTQENGVMNAFATFILRRQYIVLLTDLFEVAYLEHHDLNSIKFIIGHEMTHIRLRHATFSYNMSILFANYIPILSNALSRAREYSCDRVAQHLVGVSGIEPMLALIVGKHLYKKVDIEDYVKHCRETRGFFVFLVNLLSSHPIMPKRIQALLRDHGSGRLFF
ncbi:MAG: M48 family metallopeptidase [Clostridiales bacterium]|nr:M48 family metallopeptidase [Clostridiales bacterium]